MSTVYEIIFHILLLSCYISLNIEHFVKFNFMYEIIFLDKPDKTKDITTRNRIIFDFQN